MHVYEYNIHATVTTMLMPWKTDVIRKRLREFTEAEIKTYKSLDLRIVAACRPELRVDQVSNTFANYADARVHLNEADVIGRILPCINELISGAARTFRDVNVVPLPLHETASHSYTRLQVATCIAHMFLNAFDYDYMTPYSGNNNAIENYPTPSLVGMFKGANAFALACVLAYFDYVAANKDDPAWCKQRIIYRRYTQSRTSFAQAADAASVDEVMISDGEFDDAQSNLHIVAGNSVIGGKLFERSCTQEEAIMLARPEMLMMLLICPNPSPDGGCINVCIGAEKINEYGGIGASLHYVGKCEEGLNIVSTPAGYCIAQIAHAFVVPCRANSVDQQFIKLFSEDLYRLAVGFASVPLMRADDSVSIGNYAYEFSSCPHGLRVTQAVLAAAIAGRVVAYCTHDADLIGDIRLFADWASGRKVTDIIDIYMREISNEWRRDGAEMTTNVLGMLMSV